MRTLDTRKICKWSMLLAALFITSCSSNIDRFEGLESRIQEYYKHEKNNEWEKAYSMRTPTFRRSVPIKFYVSTSKEDNHGWRLDDIKILRAKEKNGKVYVTIKFSETAPISIVPVELRIKMASPDASTIQTERKEDSVWMRIDNDWFCYDAASRSRLSQNAPLVKE